MTYRIKTTRQFDRDVARLMRSGYTMELLRTTVKLLSEGKPLPAKYHDHPLRGDKKGFRDCHIAPDWLLLYLRRKDELVLVLQRTGSHSDILE
ncbi:MAG: type II toxin-antitoxin system YafQ family toxin [Pyramidobacter sp.]|jgi:mRNA interferase YafQ